MTHYQDKVARNKQARRLRELGCPYAPGDIRVVPWLEGHQAGIDFAKWLMKAA